MVQGAQAEITIEPSSPPSLLFVTPAASPWFKVRKVSKEQYRGMLDRSRQAAEEMEAGRITPTGEDDPPPRKSAKDKIDQSW